MGSPGDGAGVMAGWERAQRSRGSSSASPPAPSPGGMEKGLGLEAVRVTWSVEEAQEDPGQSNTSTQPRVLPEGAGGQGASIGQEAAGVHGRATPSPPPPSHLAPGTSTLEPEVEEEDEAAVPEEVRREQERLRELRRQSEASAVSATSSLVH